MMKKGSCFGKKTLAILLLLWYPIKACEGHRHEKGGPLRGVNERPPI